MPPALANLLAAYGPPVLGVLVFLMNAGLPLPGHIAYVTSVVLAAQGRMSLPLVVAVSVPAAFLGSWTGFLIGQRGGHKLIVTHGPRIGLNAERFAAMERFFARHGGAAVLVMRFIVIVRAFGSLFAGMSEYPTHRFLIFSAAGAVAWGAIYAAAGTVFGESWHTIEQWLGTVGLIVLAALAVAGLGHVWWRRRARRQK